MCIDLKSVEANIIFFSLNSSVKNQDKLSEYLESNKIKFGSLKSDGTFRIITHYYIKEEQVEQVVRHIKAFVEKNQ